jgi:chromosome segregation ATPase
LASPSANLAMNLDFLCMGVGLAVGFGAGWLSYRGRHSAREHILEEALHEARTEREQELNRLRIALAKASERSHLLEENLQELQTDLDQERQFNVSLHTELSRERTSQSHLEQKLEQQKSDLVSLQHRLSEEIKALVQQVLEEKSQTLNDANTSSLNSLLQPISEKLQAFKQKVEEQHSRETHELIVLHNKLSNIESKQLTQINGAASAARAAAAAAEQDEPMMVPIEGGFVELTPELLKSSMFTTDLPTKSSGYDAAKAEEPEDFQSFSTKQQVEIDNFFKRTLGRAQKKKVAT